MGRTIGIILLAGGVIVGIIITALMGIYYNEGSLSGGAAALGWVIGIAVLVLPQLGVGGFMLWKGGREAATAVTANKQRDLINIVKTRGQVAISDLVIEMQSTREEVEGMLHQLVGMGLFSGYVNWDEGMLYSRQASELRQLTQCENCSGELELAGKGVIRCPYCGTEYFLD
jgi:hypothetical protein